MSKKSRLAKEAREQAMMDGAGNPSLVSSQVATTVEQSQVSTETTDSTPTVAPTVIPSPIVASLVKPETSSDKATEGFTSEQNQYMTRFRKMFAERSIQDVPTILAASLAFRKIILGNVKSNEQGIKCIDTLSVALDTLTILEDETYSFSGWIPLRAVMTSRKLTFVKGVKESGINKGLINNANGTVDPDILYDAFGKAIGYKRNLAKMNLDQATNVEGEAK